jgi:hypothetical protein
MSKHLKRAVLISLRQGEISKVEAKAIIQANGKIILDLSIDGKPDPIFPIVQKIPSLKKCFINLITLGNGSRT